VSAEFADRHDLTEYQHIRIDDGHYATYYRIVEIYENTAPLVVHEDSLDRFGGADGDEVTVSTTIPQAETRERAAETGGVHEALEDDGHQDTVAVIAPHAGGIEKNTGAIAEQCHDLLRSRGIDASLWRVQGYSHPDQDISSFRVWHFSKIMRSHDSYPALRHIVDRDFEYVVGFHRSGYSHVEVGGLADRSLRDSIGEELHRQTGRDVRTDTDDMNLPGTARILSENYLTDPDDQAVHIEATPGICDREQNSAARAVVEGLEKAPEFAPV
jgi:phage replication-related protein YjqB (UPF0714/DUF867 family)